MKTIKTLSLLIIITLLASCGMPKKQTPISDSGVKKVKADIEVGSNGMTTEQSNVKRRYSTDNEIGSIKHLYVISAFSGQVILYSTVDGKVTSGGKRLTSSKKLIRGEKGQGYGDFVMPNIQDDGTYGSSMNYLYWYDVKGVYHQHYVVGGQILHISTEALPVKEIAINLSNK